MSRPTALDLLRTLASLWYFAVACVLSWMGLAHGVTVVSGFIIGLFLVTAVGLVRRTIWATGVLAFASFMCCLVACTFLIPTSDDKYSEQGPLIERILGGAPSMVAEIVAILAVCGLILYPSVVLSRQQDHFRRAMW